MNNKIQEAIENHWGPRCPDFNPECHICKVWAQYDEFMNVFVCDKPEVGNELVRTFGRCIECNAIISLDSTVNKLCDRCYAESFTTPQHKHGYFCCTCDSKLSLDNNKKFYCESCNKKGV